MQIYRTTWVYHTFKYKETHLNCYCFIVITSISYSKNQPKQTTESPNGHLQNACSTELLYIFRTINDSEVHSIACDLPT